MLKQLIQEAKRPMSLSERFRVIVEIVAYVMQPPGPKGGLFYYTPKGRKVYRQLGGKGGKARKKKQLTGEDYDTAWKNMGRRSWARGVEGSKIGATLKKMFGDKAPHPDGLEQMFSDPGRGVGCKLTELGISEDPPSFRVSYDVQDENKVSVGGLTRKFSMGEDGKPKVYHSIFTLRKAAQGKGIGGAVLGKMLDTYRKLGVNQVSVGAVGGGGYNGGYTWARFGFDAGEDTERTARDRVHRALMDEGVPKPQADWIRNMRMKDLYTTAGLSIRVPTGRLLRSGKPRMKTVKVGRNVTSQMSWNGTFDMEDPKAVARWKRQVAKGQKRREALLAKQSKARAA